MRLAIFTSEFPSHVSTFLARDIRGLLEAGIEVDVFPVRDPDGSLWQFVPDILNEATFPRERVHHLTMPRCLASAWPWSLSSFGKLLRDTIGVCASAAQYGPIPLAKSLYVLPKACAWARRPPGEYDHVLSYWGNYAATCAREFHRLVGRPVPFSMFLHAGTDLYRTRVYMKQKLLYADNVFVVCEFNREYIRQKYPRLFPRIAQKIHLHHLGLNLADLPFQAEGRIPQRVVGVGRLDRRKGFDYLLRAAGELTRRGVDVDVQLVGGGQEEGNLRRLAADLGLGNRVTFLGWQPFAEVQAAMARAAVLVHPSPEIGDAVPTVIKEAQAVGTPVVGTTVAGIPELLDFGRSGILVPPREVIPLADAIGRLLADTSLRQQYALAGRQFAETHYDMWQNGRQLADRLRATVRHGAHQDTNP
ncbi:MAG: glycosyltransferase [Thermoguttaceae bacterium]